MLYTLLVVFMITATLIIFSDNVYNFIKSNYNKPFVKLIGPLLLTSWVVLMLAPLWMMAFGSVWSGYMTILTLIMHHTPEFSSKLGICQALIITCLSLPPTLFARVTAKPFRPFKPPYWSSMYVWLALSVFVILIETKA